ncbi:hypothetical protein ACET3Z_022250 [Daucus carota]
MRLMQARVELWKFGCDPNEEWIEQDQGNQVNSNIPDTGIEDTNSDTSDVVDSTAIPDTAHSDLVVNSAQITALIQSDAPVPNANEAPSDIASTESEINPSTPRDYPHSTNEIGSKNERVVCTIEDSMLDDKDHHIHSSTMHWKPREQVSSPSILTSQSDSQISAPEDIPQDNDHIHDDLQVKITKDLEKLKVKSKRGRPRKFNPKFINKHFKVPKRKKSKGEGLQQISHFFLNNEHDEAESIYETGLVMGLLPLHSKKESINLIRKSLASN